VIEEMTITIVPFTVDASYSLSIEHEMEECTKKGHLPITYWGIYLNDKYISYTSNSELAERTKIMDREMAKGQI
jgi:hypothetical protein